jgi:hypothetical protein
VTHLKPASRHPTQDEPQTWHIRVDQKTYGPFSLDVLKDWAAHGRIAPGNTISQDRQNWFRPETLPALHMDWFLVGSTGDPAYGPFNILATPILVRLGIISIDGSLTNPQTGRTLLVASLVKPDAAEAETVEQPTSSAPQATPQPEGAPSQAKAVGARDEIETPAWYLRIGEDRVYGPLTLATLCSWAEEGRVVGDNAISRDGHNWLHAESVPALKLEWTALLETGVSFGPFNILAIPTLLQAGVVSPETELQHGTCGQSVLAGNLVRTSDSGLAGHVDTTGPAASRQWHLRRQDGTVYGPVAITRLCEWAAECRITPDHLVSSDGNTWLAAHEVPELDMNWLVTLPNGRACGPLNVFAVNHLIRKGDLDPASVAQNCHTGRCSPAGDLLQKRPSRSVVQQIRNLKADNGDSEN